MVSLKKKRLTSFAVGSMICLHQNEVSQEKTQKSETECVKIFSSETEYCCKNMTNEILLNL